MSTGVHRPSTTFRDLALALSEEERRSLLGRISKSLDFKQRHDEQAFRSVVDERSRAGVIARELREMGFFERLRFLIRRLLSTHSDEQTYVEFRLARLRRRARLICPDLGAIEHHSISSAIPSLAWELYRAAYPVIPLFLDLWKRGNYLQESVEYLLSQRIPSARGQLYDFTSLDTLQDIFKKSELKGDVRTHVMEELDRYLAGIPDELFGHLEAGLLPFYYLRQICLFDYNEFFEVFGFDPGIAPPEEVPPFRDAPASAALGVVERLYYGLHSAGKLDEGFYCHTEVLDRYLEMKEREERAARSDEPDDGSNSADVASEDDEQAYQRRRVYLQDLRDQIHALHKASRRLARQIPFADLIRYYTRDPWLRIRSYLPELKLREFYRSYLTIRVLSQLDRQFPEIRRGVVEKMSEELFGGSPPTMTYFRSGVQIIPENGGLPAFTHMRSVTVAYNFLRFIYRGRMQEMMRTLSRILPVRQRDSSSDLITHVSGVEEALADMEDFDESFSPDSEEGKSYYRVRYAVEKDATMQRSFRNLVQQRDREAVELVDRTVEHVQGLVRVFDSIRRGLTDQLRERYAASDHRVNALDGVDRLLEEQQTKSETFLSLIRQVRAMEEGY